MLRKKAHKCVCQKRMIKVSACLCPRSSHGRNLFITGISRNSLGQEDQPKKTLMWESEIELQDREGESVCVYSFMHTIERRKCTGSWSSKRTNTHTQTKEA